MTIKFPVMETNVFHVNWLLKMIGKPNVTGLDEAFIIILRPLDIDYITSSASNKQYFD